MKELLQQCAERLKKHGFDVEIVPDTIAAGKRLTQDIEQFKPQSISYGDSMTVIESGIVDTLRVQSEIKFYDGFDHTMPREQRLEIRRAGLCCHYYFTGVNAISAKGSLHWLDMIGNRIAPIAFGPERVVIMAGVNKIAKNAKKAEKRIQNVAAPLNIARHEGFRTPCAKTGKCADCNSPDRICNTHLIMERCFPKKRILVILIEQELGL